jgi:hypothetical protein
MNLPEFKAWFEGFTEGLSGPPNAKQWKRINEKIDKIEDAPPVTLHHFHDHYYRPWRRFYEGPYWGTSWTALGVGTLNQAGSLAMQCSNSAAQHGALASNNMSQTLSALPSPSESTFDSQAAFQELGRAEARSMAR